MRESGNGSRRRMALVFLLAAVLVSSGIAITPLTLAPGCAARWSRSSTTTGRTRTARR